MASLRKNRPEAKRVSESTKTYFTRTEDYPSSTEFLSVAAMDEANVLALLEAASVAGASVYFGFNRSGGVKVAVYCASERPEFWAHTVEMLKSAVASLWDGLDAYAASELGGRYNRLRQTRFGEDVPIDINDK